MREINLDATNWTNMVDFCDALLPALGAPQGHGYSVDALLDSMIWGGMNAVEPPYVVRVHATKTLPKKLLDDLVALRGYFAEAREEFRVREGQDVEVSLEIVS